MKKKDFDQDMMNTWTDPAFEFVQLEQAWTVYTVLRILKWLKVVLRAQFE